MRALFIVLALFAATDSARARSHHHERHAAIHELHRRVHAHQGTLEENAKRVSNYEKRACLPDAIRLCGATPSSTVASIGGCMLVHRSQLSRSCQSVFAAHGF